MKFSLTSPDWNKVFNKDNYHKYTLPVPTGAGADNTITVKVLVFE
jgi:hypothetical protein